MSWPAALLNTLADGRFHSGAALAAQAGISRSAVWKQVAKLAALGLDIQRVPGRGYRLAAPLELLDAARIRAGLRPPGLVPDALYIAASLPSTNAWLLAHDGADPAACLAEHQSAGRGRRGRGWVSPFAANLYLSLSWRFEALPPQFSALSLVVGVVCAEVLAAAGAPVALKWPNDLQLAGRKLGGILLEMTGEPPGPCRAVIGIGINWRMPEGVALDQAWADLAGALGRRLPGRNALAADLLNALLAMLPRFAAQGFAPWQADWERFDALAGSPVTVHTGQAPVAGTALGVDADGALRVRTAQGVQRFWSGDVSVRGAA